MRWAFLGALLVSGCGQIGPAPRYAVSNGVLLDIQTGDTWRLCQTTGGGADWCPIGKPMTTAERAEARAQKYYTSDLVANGGTNGGGLKQSP